MDLVGEEEAPEEDGLVELEELPDDIEGSDVVDLAADFDELSTDSSAQDETQVIGGDNGNGDETELDDIWAEALAEQEKSEKKAGES